MIRSAGVLCLLLLGALGCGDDDSEDECPAPTQAIVGPAIGPSLSSVPACEPRDQPQERSTRSEP
jgi:hypothetical protein